MKSMAVAGQDTYIQKSYILAKCFLSSTFDTSYWIREIWVEIKAVLAINKVTMGMLLNPFTLQFPLYKIGGI